MSKSFSPHAAYRIRSAVGAEIRRRIREYGRPHVVSITGASDPTVRAWYAGSNPSLPKAREYAPKLGLDPDTGKAIA